MTILVVEILPRATQACVLHVEFAHAQLPQNWLLEGCLLLNIIHWLNLQEQIIPTGSQAECKLMRI